MSGPGLALIWKQELARERFVHRSGAWSFCVVGKDRRRNFGAPRHDAGKVVASHVLGRKGWPPRVRSPSVDEQFLGSKNGLKEFSLCQVFHQAAL